MIVLQLALASLRARLGMFLLTVTLIAMSVALVVGVDKVRHGARSGFAGTISGTDLILGARGGGVQLLLYSVFRIGDAPNNVTWTTYQDISSRGAVAWAVPISLGDSHRGYRVVGTETSFFELMKYRDGQRITFAQGQAFDDLFEVVIGADVAQRLGYVLGDSLVLAHGSGSVALVEHDALPFSVVGVLAPTRTPVDKAVYVSLQAIEAIHVDWQTGAPATQSTPAEALRQMDLTPRSISAAFIGLTSPLASFTLQREINQYADEPLTAILPNLTLLELWAVLSTAETGLQIVTWFVVLTALLGMVATILALLAGRRREMAILRSIGAGPRHIAALLWAEGTVIGLAGSALGLGLAYLVVYLAASRIEAALGVQLPPSWPSLAQGLICLAVGGAAGLAGLVPAWKAYRTTLADGITIRN